MDNQPNDQAKRQSKDTEYAAEIQVFYEHLKGHTETATQVTESTGIPQKNICRYKRELEKAGLLWEVELVFCPCTGYEAWTLTTDPDKAPKNEPQPGDVIQLTLFSRYE